MFMALYRAIALCVVLGVIIALTAIACAVAVIALFGAVVYGLVSRKQTVGSALRALGVNAAAGVELIGALRPQTSEHAQLMKAPRRTPEGDNR